jgi:hypothetical protein
MIPNAEERITKEISKWDGIEIRRHRFGGTEFRFGSRELGHVHGNYQADIAFPMNIRNKLVEENRASPHHILPKSGWITFRFGKESDIESATNLFRLAYYIAKNRKTSLSVPPATI